MKQKILFFDIDGTIWNIRNEIPESTKRAVEKLKENGHLVFLNSGRSRAFIREPGLLSMGFDGIVSGCGTMAEFRGETIYQKKIGPDLAEFAVNTLSKHRFYTILEGFEDLYFDKEVFEDDVYGSKILREIPDHVVAIKDSWRQWDFGKFSCNTKDADVQAGYEELSPYFEFVFHDIPVIEVVPKGYSKGTGVKKVCEFLGIDRRDSFAFGDSANDIDMFTACGTSVAMGSGSEKAKSAADYVTTGLQEDGIWNACVHYGLI